MAGLCHFQSDLIGRFVPEQAGEVTNRETAIFSLDRGNRMEVIRNFLPIGFELPADPPISGGKQK